MIKKYYLKKYSSLNKKLKQAYDIIEKSSTVVIEWSMGMGTPVKFVTENICIFGYTQEDFYSGKVDFWDFVYAEDRQKTMDIVWNARKENLTEYKHTYRVVCKNGDIKWVEEWTLLERSNDGKALSEKGILRDITAQKEAEEKLVYLTYHDKLTDLFNRTYFDEILNMLYKDNLFPFSLIIGDVNGLKLTNDALGHKEGDILLQNMSKILRNSCDKDSIICRIGGDEFAIILTHGQENLTNEICNKIRFNCKNSSCRPIKPSIALGYAIVKSPEQSISEIIKEADDNMYRNKLNENNSIRSSIISSLQATLEKKTQETKEHAERIKTLCLSLGKNLDLTPSQMDELAISAIMHDIGKVAIPDNILQKPSQLDEDEWEIMKKHTEIGYHIILSSQNLISIANQVLSHHERWDGSGYPNNLKGDEIPIISRIISIVDSYDVMLHDRPYKKAFSKEEAMEEIKRCSGTQFDPNIAKIFLELLNY